MDKFDREAKKLGFRLTRGDYQGTSDDRLNRWYAEAIEANYAHRPGPGSKTKREALEELRQDLARFSTHEDAIAYYTRYN